MTLADKDTFKELVLDAKGLVIVDYFGDGCIPCEALLPDVEALSEKYSNDVKFIKFNTSKARRIAISQKILGLPTISLYKDGVKIDEVIKDDATKESIEQMILKYVKSE